MVKKAYFANSVDDTISVNLNDNLQNEKLSPRQLLDGNGAERISLPAVSFDIGPDLAKGKFGIDDINRVQIEFETVQSNGNYFDIKVDNALAGQNLFFYVFENTLVGQNEVGASEGIEIQIVEFERTLIGHDEIGSSRGISIHAHEVVKRMIQTGVKTPGIKAEDL